MPEDKNSSEIKENEEEKVILKKEETTEEKSRTNHPQDQYQQYRFDSRKVTYFVDDNGYFVVRFNETYDYTTEGPK